MKGFHFHLAGTVLAAAGTKPHLEPLNTPENNPDYPPQQMIVSKQT